MLPPTTTSVPISLSRKSLKRKRNQSICEPVKKSIRSDCPSSPIEKVGKDHASMQPIRNSSCCENVIQFTVADGQQRAHSYAIKLRNSFPSKQSIQSIRFKPISLIWLLEINFDSILPEMFVNMNIKYSNSIQERLVKTKGALIFDLKKEYLLDINGKNQYKKFRMKAINWNVTERVLSVLLLYLNQQHLINDGLQRILHFLFDVKSNLGNVHIYNNRHNHRIYFSK